MSNVIIERGYSVTFFQGDGCTNWQIFGDDGRTVSSGSSPPLLAPKDVGDAIRDDLHDQLKNR